MARIAVILPAAYRGGTLRWLKHLALMLRRGARNRGFDLEVVVCVLQDRYDLRNDFRSLRDEQIVVRPFQWRLVSRRDAEEMLELANLNSPEPLEEPEYALVDDGHNQLLDCDCWWFVCDRVPRAVVPLRPYAVNVTDVLQRYVPAAATADFLVQESGVIRPLLRQAVFATATTPTTAYDLQSYYGLPSERIETLPFFIEHDYPVAEHRAATPDGPYFVWSTNAGVHKNHGVVLDALEIYDALPQARLKAFMIGPSTREFDSGGSSTPSSPQVAALRERIASTPALLRRIVIGGELPESQYHDALRRCRFLLNANLNDNGSFAVSDAVYLRRPVLTSEYPAQRFIDERLRLNGVFFDPHDPRELAEKLAWMERSADEVALPSAADLDRHAWPQCADEVFDVAYRRLLEEATCVYR
jgi:glycosyltransferase involved in cell wall biosynthesis